MASVNINIGVACLVLWMVVVNVHCILKDHCPVGCECDPKRRSVLCNNGNWNELPKLPSGTKEIMLSNGKALTLNSTQACAAYREVEVLNFQNNTIKTIDDNFLRCFPNLQSYAFEFNYFRNISKSVYEQMPDVRNIAVTGYAVFNLTDRLCGLRRLETLALRYGFGLMASKGLACLGSLSSLSDVTFMSEFLPGGNLKNVVAPLKNVSNSIRLRLCNMTRLMEDTFAGFQTKHLDLSLSEISRIDKNAFRDMPHLQTIDLSFNPVHDIHKFAFSNLPQLQYIDLTLMRVIDNEIFRFIIDKFRQMRNKNIKEGREPILLELKNIAPLESHKPLDRLSVRFLPKLSLTGIDLSGNFITQVNKEAIRDQRKLEVFNIGYNFINNTGLSSLLSVLVGFPLRKLDVRNNPIGSLNGLFDVHNMSMLEELNLKECEIKDLQTASFRSLEQLRVLDLSLNSLKILPNDVFANLASLEILHLNHNKLLSFEAQSVGLQFTNISEIYLQNNIINHVDIRILPNLQILDLSSNDIHLNSPAINDLPSLRDLRLPRNYRNVFAQYYLLFSFPKLENLDLSGNQLGNQPNISFVTPNLEFLDLTNLDFSKLLPWSRKHLLRNLTRLEKLFVNHCHLYSPLQDMFRGLGRLRHLEVKSNEIYELESGAFYSLKNLRILLLDENKITKVTWMTFIDVPKLRVLSLIGNPLICTCDNIWLIQAVATNNIVYMESPDKHICVSPVGGTPVKLSLRLRDCEEELALRLAPLGYALASLLVILLVFIAWRMRWQIRYTFFLAKAGLGRYAEFVDEQEYSYDAFVAYSSSNLDWVTDQLMVNLDAEYVGEQGFKLCVHERDWLVGVDITENIVKSIVESRKTILVLSKEFAKSQWCQFELATAHMRMEAEGHKKGRLIIILLDDIPAHLLTPRIVYFLSLKTYLQWPQDPQAQGHFWKTLRKSLRKDLLYSHHTY